MYEFIKSPPDVFALKLSGTITGDDLGTIMDKFEDYFAKPGKFSIYVETHDIKGLQFSALPDHFRRAFPLFGDLKRFERIAVVADQAWLRVLTRFESAMLPYVSYRVYEPKERSEAIDWAFKEKIPA